MGRTPGGRGENKPNFRVLEGAGGHGCPLCRKRLPASLRTVLLRRTKPRDGNPVGRGRAAVRERIVRNKPNFGKGCLENKCCTGKDLRPFGRGESLGKTKPIRGTRPAGRGAGEEDWKHPAPRPADLAPHAQGVEQTQSAESLTAVGRLDRMLGLGRPPGV